MTAQLDIQRVSGIFLVQDVHQVLSARLDAILRAHVYQNARLYKE